MLHFFNKRDRWGHGMALWALVAMVFVAPLAFWSLKKVHMHNDARTWLPSEDGQARALQWYLDNFKRDERILVSWDGSTLNDPRVARFAAKLHGVESADGIRRNGLKQVDRVIMPHELIGRMDVERDEAIRRLQGVLIGTGRMKVRLTDAGRDRKQHITKTLVRRSKFELGLDIEIIDPAVEWIETDAASKFADALAEVEESVDQDAAAASDGEQAEPFPDIPEHDFQVRWLGQQPKSELVEKVEQLARSIRGSPTKKNSGGVAYVDDCFFAAGSPVACSVTLSEAGVADKAAAIEAIRAAAAEVGIEPGSFHMGGSPVANAALNEEVKKAAWNRDYPIHEFHKRSVILLSGLVGVVLAFVMLRSFRLAIMVLAVSYYTTFLATAVVPATGGSMNMVLIVMPTLLLVLTLSAAIHVANYWKHCANNDPRTAVIKAAQMAAVPCGLASITTAIGLLSLTTSPLTPVRDFGMYSAVGCIIGLVMVLYGLPSLLQLWPAKVPDEAHMDRSGWEFLGRQLARHRVPVSVGSAILFGVSAYGLNFFQTETKAIRYFPEDSRTVQDYNFLEENLAGIVPVELIVRFDKNAQDPNKGLNFLERMEVVREIEERMRQHPGISGVLSLADFRSVSEKPPKTANFLAKARYNQAANQMQRRLKDEKHSDASAFLAFPKEATDLVADGDEGLNKAGDELWRLTAQVAIMSDLNYGDLTNDLDQIAQTTLKFHPGAGHVVTGMVPLFLRTQQAVLDSLIHSFGLAFIVIAIVMSFVLKNPFSGLLTMLPNLMPIGVVFGLISWAGMRVDIGTMITASVSLGIAVDGTLHLLTWYRDAIATGRTRRKAVEQALAHCGPAMLQTSLVVGVGLLMLFPANLLLINRFGWLMAALVGMALVADIIFLPALLAGPLGLLIMRTTPYRDPRAKTDEEDDVLIELAGPSATASSRASKTIPGRHTGSSAKLSPHVHPGPDSGREMETT